jgi:hypothetical protein
MIISKQLNTALKLDREFTKAVEKGQSSFVYTQKVKEQFAQIGILIPLQAIPNERILILLKSKIEILSILQTLIDPTA